MAKIKKLFLALLIVIFSSSCLVVYRDYPRRQNIRYHHISIWGGWYDYYWSNIWYAYRYMRYANRYSYQGKKAKYIVHKSSLQKPPSDSPTEKKTVTKNRIKRKESSSPPRKVKKSSNRENKGNKTSVKKKEKK